MKRYEFQLTKEKEFATFISVYMFTSLYCVQEVSLAFLLNSVWIPSELPQIVSDADTPSLIRRASIRKSADASIADKRTSTPTSLARYHLNADVLAADSRRESFPGQVLHDNHTPQYIIINYQPQFLDNKDLFASCKTTTLTPPGYRVSQTVAASYILLHLTFLSN